MLRPIAMTIAAAGLLSACTVRPEPATDALSVAMQRVYAENFQDHPFDSGPVSVISSEHGDLHTFKLRPCGGNHICGTHRGHVTRTQDLWVVKGAYHGRTFYFSAGGDGWMEGPSGLIYIAWN